jgi:hypothetical protein
MGDEEGWSRFTGPLLPVPIVLPLFVATGLRHAFTVPAELRANWIFQQGCSEPAAYLAGARKASLFLATAPLLALLPVFIAAWGWKAGGWHILFGVAMMWLLVEAFMAGLEKLPFTCSYVPGKANVRSWWTMYVIAYLTYVGTLSWVELKILNEPRHALWFAAGVLAARGVIAMYRRHDQQPDRPLLFDERPAPAVLTLDL